MSLSFYVPPSRFFDDEWTIFDPLNDFKKRRAAGNDNLKMQQLSPLLSSDLIETEDSFRIHTDLPGVQPSDLSVKIEGKSLVISAERKHVHDTKTDKVHSMERSYGQVQRSFRIPQNVDISKVETTFKNGELNIVFPKVAPPAPASIQLEIKTA